MTPATSSGGEVSHESLCVVNRHPVDRSIVLEAYFEDREPEASLPVAIPARRSLHLRLDDATRIGGLAIPRGVPYALVVEADGPLDLQYSRLDTTQAAYALMSIVPIHD